MPQESHTAHNVQVCGHGWAVEDRCADCFGPHPDFGCVMLADKPGDSVGGAA